MLLLIRTKTDVTKLNFVNGAKVSSSSYFLMSSLWCIFVFEFVILLVPVAFSRRLKTSRNRQQIQMIATTTMLNELESCRLISVANQNFSSILNIAQDKQIGRDKIGCIWLELEFMIGSV